MEESSRPNRGFSLIELLIVMVIIGMLAALVGPRFWGQTDKARQRSAKAQITNFETALDVYRLDTGRYPDGDQGLKALRTRPAGAGKWDGPYLPKEIPADPWGNPYEYRMPGEHGEYDILSYGADGQPGGEGNDMDIVSWKDLEG
ncbi:MAG: type II secretion system protein GspG [Desulfobacterales bacterium]|nr:MAG: type II secretion system protein GspG [Desulfobacterales bacterium]